MSVQHTPVVEATTNRHFLLAHVLELNSTAQAASPDAPCGVTFVIHHPNDPGACRPFDR